jgi:hypothetical protein
MKFNCFDLIFVNTEMSKEAHDPQGSSESKWPIFKSFPWIHIWAFDVVLPSRTIILTFYSALCEETYINLKFSGLVVLKKMLYNTIIIYMY